MKTAVRRRFNKSTDYGNKLDAKNVRLADMTFAEQVGEIGKPDDYINLTQRLYEERQKDEEYINLRNGLDYLTWRLKPGNFNKSMDDMLYEKYLQDWNEYLDDYYHDCY